MSSELDSELDEFENIDDASELVEEIGDNVEEIGETSTESAADEVAESATPSRDRLTARLDFLKTLTIYDAMLIASALSVSLACLLLLLELTSFGSLFSFPWRTGEAFVEPLTPP